MGLILREARERYRGRPASRRGHRRRRTHGPRPEEPEIGTTNWLEATLRRKP